jgi:hypothetical protein
MGRFYFVLNIPCAQSAPQKKLRLPNTRSQFPAQKKFLDLVRSWSRDCDRSTCPVQRGTTATGMLSKCCHRNLPPQLRDPQCW